MCKTKLRSFLNNEVKPFQTLKAKFILSLSVSHTCTPQTNIKNYLKNTSIYTKSTLNISGVKGIC